VHGRWRSRPGGSGSHRGREGPGASPRYVRLLRREIDLDDGDAEFANLRQDLEGLEPSLVGRIDPPLHRLLIAARARSDGGSPSTQRLPAAAVRG